MLEPLSKIPSGMRYYFGAEARLRRAVEDVVMGVFDGWSYEEITTPAVDYYALFERGMGHAEAHRAFRFTDTDGDLLALRPDVTSTVARAAATLFAAAERPLRLCYAASVFQQQSRSHAEWRRESKHLGCELIGSSSSAAVEMEVLMIATEVLDRLGLRRNNCCITLNSVEVFKGVAERLQLDGTSREQMRQLIDTRAADELQRFLLAHAPTEPEDCRSFARLVCLSGKREVLTEARRVITNKRSVAALDLLEELWSVIEDLNFTDHFEIDFGDVSGHDYYTGLVCKIYVAGAGTRVGGGGRYDGLTANFGQPEPAIGFVLDLDALTDVLRRSNSALARETDRSAASLNSSDPSELFLKAQQKRAGNGRVQINAAPMNAEG